MGWKEFFKLTWKKIILSVVIGLILYYLLIYSTSYIECINPPCKNSFLEKTGTIVNIIPVLFLFLIGKIDLRILPSLIEFLIQFFLVIMAYFIVPFLWTYFLVCLMSRIVRKIKSKSKKK